MSINFSQTEIPFFKSSPLGLAFKKNLTVDAFTNSAYDNTFTVFRSLKNQILLVYTKEAKSLCCYDLTKEKVVTVIVNAHHWENIFTIKHFQDKEKNQDIIISGSNFHRCIKVWSLKNWKCLVTIENIYQKGYMISISIFNHITIDNNNNNTNSINTINNNVKNNSNKLYIITSSKDKEELIKVWDFNGSLAKDINDSNDNMTGFIDSFYDQNNNKDYIISGNEGYLKSFDFKENKLYKKYQNENYSKHFSALINYFNNKINLVSCSDFGDLCYWDFNSGNLIKKIKIGVGAVGMCLWNENYIIAGDRNSYEIYVIDIKTGEKVKKINEHKSVVCCIKKIWDPVHGECLITQGWGNDQIKLWIVQ